MKRIIRPIQSLKNEIQIGTPVTFAALNTEEEVLNYLTEEGFVRGNFVDLEAVIEANDNLKLIKSDLDGKDGYIASVGEGNYEICVNINHPKNRQRFTMAHELSHYFLHRNKISGLKTGEKILFRGVNIDPIEAEANRFAAAILMPEELIKILMDEHKGSIIRIARELQVSTEALTYRAEKLGYLRNG